MLSDLDKGTRNTLCIEYLLLCDPRPSSVHIMTALLLLVSGLALAASQVPNRPPTYVMNQSTIIMPVRVI